MIVINWFEVYSQNKVIPSVELKVPNSQVWLFQSIKKYLSPYLTSQQPPVDKNSTNRFSSRGSLLNSFVCKKDICVRHAMVTNLDSFLEYIESILLPEMEKILKS